MYLHNKCLGVCIITTVFERLFSGLTSNPATQTVSIQSKRQVAVPRVCLRLCGQSGPAEGRCTMLTVQEASAH